MSIESGIYLHFEGKLYFVLGSARHYDDLENDWTEEVIYHPLYQTKNSGWRKGISVNSFLGYRITLVENDFVPMFTKIMNYGMPNILPGHIWIDPRRECEPNPKNTLLHIVEVKMGNSAFPIVVLKDFEGVILEKNISELISHCIYSNMVNDGYLKY